MCAFFQDSVKHLESDKDRVTAEVQALNQKFQQNQSKIAAAKSELDGVMREKENVKGIK